MPGPLRGILLIDDNPDDRTLASRHLLRAFPGLRIREASTAAGLAQALETGGFDAVITDYYLGWTTGLDVLRTVKERWPSCPVIMYTGTGNERIAVEAMKSGLDDYVLKDPAHFARLPVALRAALDAAEHQRREAEAEQRYRDLFDSVPVGLFRSRPDGTLLDANAADVRVLGFPDRETFLRTNIADLYVDPADRDSFLEELERYGAVSGFEARLRRYDGSVLWVKMNAHPTYDASGGLLHIDGVVEDITARKLAEAELLRSLAKLQRVLEGTVRAMSLTLEMRDPYTAGHQRRATQLADAIALAMGLPDDRRSGLHIAGMLHDLGKIVVPSDILNKPGKLNEYEFAIIKSHPQVGHDILKTIEFPWQVATIVQQHHERYDGSGYPRGLERGEILLESRILAVADVVEAISSHRPYRAALGLERALAEITAFRGHRFDPEVVDICRELLVSEAFVFEGEMRLPESDD